MGVNALHLVTITVGDALHHVFDVANDSSHGGDVLTTAEPFLHLDSARKNKSLLVTRDIEITSTQSLQPSLPDNLTHLFFPSILMSNWVCLKDF